LHEDRIRGRLPFALGAFLGGLLLYGLTCAPGVVWQDSAMFQFRVWHGDLAGDLGLPLSHPLYILLAELFCLLPLDDFAFRVNLFSAVCGAACLAVTVDLLISLTRSRFAAAVGTLLLAVSHTFWAHAVIAEVYDLYALGLVAELWLIERFVGRHQVRWLVLAALVNGLNLSNHLMAILHWPTYLGLVIWALRVRRIRPVHLPALLAAFLVGCLPYLILIFREMLSSRPAFEVLKEALVGPPSRATFVLAVSFSLARQIARTVLYFALNFPTPLALLIPAGVWIGWTQPRIRWFVALSAGIFLADFVFAVRYLVADQYVFFMPCYVIAALLAGLAVPRLAAQSLPRRVVIVVLAMLPAAVYEAAPSVLRRENVALGVGRDIPTRDTYAYFIRPRKNGDESAQRFAEAAFEQAAPDGLLLADITIKNVLVCVRDVEGLHRGVTLNYGQDTTPALPAVEFSSDAVRPFAERGKAFVCSAAAGYVPSWLLEEYNLTPAGMIFRLVPKSSGPAAPL